MKIRKTDLIARHKVRMKDETGYCYEITVNLGKGSLGQFLACSVVFIMLCLEWILCSSNATVPWWKRITFGLPIWGNWIRLQKFAKSETSTALFQVVDYNTGRRSPSKLLTLSEPGRAFLALSEPRRAFLALSESVLRYFCRDSNVLRGKCVWFWSSNSRVFYSTDWNSLNLQKEIYTTKPPWRSRRKKYTCIRSLGFELLDEIRFGVGFAMSAPMEPSLWNRSGMNFTSCLCWFRKSFIFWSARRMTIG